MAETERCYMCDKEATSSEHVPPRCIFPENKDIPNGNFRVNLITVPSCPEHNNKKSKDDEYLLLCLLSCFPGNKSKEDHFNSKLMRAINRRPETFANLLDGLHPILIRDKNGVVEETGAFSIDRNRFDKIIINIARALYYHEKGEQLTSPGNLVTNIMIDLYSSNAAQKNSQKSAMIVRLSKFFASIESAGENPEIFSYRLYIQDSKSIIFELTFHEEIKFFVWFKNT